MTYNLYNNNQIFSNPYITTKKFKMLILNDKDYITNKLTQPDFFKSTLHLTKKNFEIYNVQLKFVFKFVYDNKVNPNF